jgi:hypothetical protein
MVLCADPASDGVKGFTLDAVPAATYAGYWRYNARGTTGTQVEFISLSILR